jgi:3-phenylpropionate/trans-cinnamate dioxygenase ferredoxin subunit
MSTERASADSLTSLRTVRCETRSCSHEAETLSDGEVAGEEIICPRHGAHFSIPTGAALSPPAYEPVATFPVRVEGGMVMVKDDRWS